MESLSFIPPPPLPIPPQPADNPRKKLLIRIGIAAGALVLVGFALVAISGVKLLAGAMQEPSKALSTYTDTLIRTDYHTAYSIASPDLRAAASYHALLEYHGKLVDRLGALKGVKQTYWHIETKNGQTASTIQANFQFEHGIEMFEFDLHKENGTWRVFSYKPLSTPGVSEN
jgi:hypothetical protein